MDGIILINKEKDYTSNDVVQIVKKVFNEKVGHTGTLDPMATGVLPILIGKGTKCAKYLVNHDKVYTAELKLGIKTDTGDITGNIIENRDIENKISFKYVNDILQNFVGEQKQIPPMYSAIKFKGRKLYEYAREGKTIDIKPREIKIYGIELISIHGDLIRFRVNCSKGTYIRTLCEDIAVALGNIGTMYNLNREQVGDFLIKDSITLDALKANFEDKNFLDKYFITIEKLFKHKNKIILSSKNYRLFINGARLFYEKDDGIYRIYDMNKDFLGIGIIEKKILKKVINL